MDGPVPPEVAPLARSANDGSGETPATQPRDGAVASPTSPGASADANANANANANAGAGNGGAGDVDVQPVAADGAADDGAASAPVDPGGPTVVNFEPTTIQVFSLPINSVRIAAAGFDPVARVCVSIVWDYSNNDLAFVRQCGDLLAEFQPFSPYVLLSPDRDEPCRDLWDYEGLAPTAVSGCIDPLDRLVNAQVEVEAAGTHYLIHATNDATL